MAKSINLEEDKYEEARALAAEVAAERGVNRISIPAILAEAMKFYRDNRPKMGKPSETK